MSRTQAECRHHGRHMKQKRRQYFRVFSECRHAWPESLHAPNILLMPYVWKSGERHGMSWQEINYHLRYADWQEDKCTMISP